MRARSIRTATRARSTVASPTARPTAATGRGCATTATTARATAARPRPASACSRDNTDECSDGDPCTTADACRGGVCAGNAIGCNDNNTCTTDSCEAGNCVFAPVETGTSCDDQNGCTGSDKCTGSGVCVGSGGPDCDDGDPCTKNQCESSACYNTEYEPARHAMPERQQVPGQHHLPLERGMHEPRREELRRQQPLHGR